MLDYISCRNCQDQGHFDHFIPLSRLSAVTIKRTKCNYCKCNDWAPKDNLDYLQYKDLTKKLKKQVKEAARVSKDVV